MRIFYDCEFREDGKTIDLISIGMVTEHGQTYYAVSDSFSWRKFRNDPWLMKNVLPGLPSLPGDAKHWYPNILINKNHPCVKSRKQIAREVHSFILRYPRPELWAWCGAYDHVALCQLWGRMIDKPVDIPNHTNDIKQERIRLGYPQVPRQEHGFHNALEDAIYNKQTFEYLANLQ